MAKFKDTGLNDKIERFKQQAFKKLAVKYEESIRKDIDGGRSPVKGKGRFQKYSDSYRQAIDSGRYSEYSKRKRPVNMKLSGDMMKSFSARAFRDRILIKFDSFLADIHNRRGAGKSKTVRRLLPTRSGETFNQSIQRDVREVLTRLANKIFK